MQTKTMSVVEIFLGTSFKFACAMAMWHFIAGPLFDLEITIGKNFLLTGLFTINSMVIGYAVRRFFNNRSGIYETI